VNAECGKKETLGAKGIGHKAKGREYGAKGKEYGAKGIGQ
jgi:hypothetical protein